MFGKRADHIRGVPGLIRVMAESGAFVLAAAVDHAMLDVTIGKITTPPHPITAIPELYPLPEHIDDLIVNPPLPADLQSSQSAIELAEAVATDMQNRGHPGTIVFVTPIERTGPGGSIAAFLRGEMENLAARLAPNAIRVNAVATGPVGSTRRGQPQSHRATPLGHVTVHPVDVGKAVWFLVNSGLSAAVTGTTLRVDRGAAVVRPDW
jgi:NAD(P)-dependent dehydrogenase (short-subunit alcohol dehydrogenase family)